MLVHKVLSILALILAVQYCVPTSIIPVPDAGQVAIDEERLVSDLYLAGTHDACAFVSGGPLIVTQDVTLEEQLQLGIRVFDLRLRPVGDGSGKMIAYHGIASQKQELTQDILPLFVRFIQEHPDQFVFLSFKAEGSGIKGDQESYAEALTKALSAPEVSALLFSDLTEETTVADIRGRIIPLHRSSLGSTTYGAHFTSWKDDATFETNVLGYSGATMPTFIQDNYKISRIDAEDKRIDIVNAFEVAHKHPTKRLNIFYISGTGPLCYPDRAAHLLNPALLSLFQSTQTLTPPPGIYFLDFVGRESAPELVQTINKQNFK